MTARPPTVAARAAYALLLAAIGFVAVPKHTYVHVGASGIQLSDALVILAALATAVDCALRRRLVRRDLLAAFGVYLAGALLSLTEADNLRWSVLKIFGIGTLFAALAVSVHVVDTRAAWRRARDVWLAAALAISAAEIVAIIAFALGSRSPVVIAFVGSYGSLPPGGFPRWEGTFLNSNMLSNYLGISVCLYLTRLDEHPPSLRYWLGALVLLAPLPFTMSPNLGAVAVSALVVLVVGRPFARWLRAALAAGSLAAATAFFALTMFMIVPRGVGDIPLGRVDLLLAPSGRAAALAATVDTIRAHPLTGTGAGEPVARFHHDFATQGTVQKPTEHFMEAHNIYVGLLAQMGPLALIGFLAIVWLLLRGIHRLPPSPYRWARAGFLGAIVGQTLYGGMFGGFEDARHTWLLFALAASLPMVAADEPAAQP